MIFFKRVLVLFFVTTVLGCDRGKFVKKSSKASTLFTLTSSSRSGINFKNTVKQSNDFNCLNYTYALIGAGVAVGDINNDGLQDIYFVSNQNSNKLYLNKGDFRFEDISKFSMTTDSEGWSTGVTMVDINNDGWLDIYVCKSASLNNADQRRNKLFINQKDGTFLEDAKSWGLDFNGFSIQSYFFDYDRDGDLDMYLVNHRVDFENTLRIEKRENQKYYPETSDQLFRNDGNTFSNVTTQAKLINKAWGLSASIGDFNNDGWPDVYVANDYIAPDFLYINNRDGTFSNQINKRLKHISYNSMGSDFADINNDFLPDLFVLEMAAEDHVRSKENMPSMNVDGFEKIVRNGYHHPYMLNVLQLNNGNGSFSDIAQLAGMAKTDWSWSPLMADFDNDGYKDVVVTNGVERNFSNQDYARKVKENLDEGIEMTKMEVIEMMPSDKLANYCFRNNGDLTFENTTKQWGMELKQNSNGVVYADLDNDGDLDLVMNNMDDQVSIYENNSVGNFLNVKLIGHSRNTKAIGSKVKLFSKENKQYQEVYGSRGYLSSVSNILNFGMGTEETIEKLEIVWDNGLVSSLEDLKVNQTIICDIKDAKAYPKTKLQVNRKIKPVKQNRLGIHYVHEENEFNDFSRQVLLPQKLSMQGPALDVVDVNNDGLDDFFVGGAQGQEASLYIQNGKGQFKLLEQPAFVLDKGFEDVKALFFDADNDGDKDLYVTSGTYELSEKSRLLQDRLYVNNGTGYFSKSSGLPKMLTSSKVVKAFDYDNDNDLDLFIGGYVVPGKYPLASKSYVLENNNGTFKDVTDSVAPELSEIGLVNDMLCTDVDSDGLKDIIVVGEWMPITVLKNNGKTFQKNNIEAFKNTDGWWQAVLEIDIDNDGDLDYVFGNLGNNNKFHPSLEKPLHIYSKYFDSDSSYDMILSKEYKGNLVPVRGKECSTQQNAFVSERLTTYKAFANATLLDIYGNEALESSYHKEVYQFSSAYAINNGNGNFSLKEMPSTAQLGPTLGFEFADINNDGYKDVLGVGAIHESEVETVRYDANTGYILFGGADGNLKPYKDLNFYLGDNAKAIKKINISGHTYFMIANNNAPLNIFRK